MQWIQGAAEQVQQQKAKLLLYKKWAAVYTRTPKKLAVWPRVLNKLFKNKSFI
jgi:hypothetical protein